MCSLAIMTFLAGWVLGRVHIKILDKLREKFWSGRTRNLFRASRRNFADEYDKMKPILQAFWVGQGWALNRSLAKAFDVCALLILNIAFHIVIRNHENKSWR